MSADERDRSPEEHRKLLERRANVVRARLLRTIDALDSRRHQVENIGATAKKVALPVAASFLGIAVVAAGTVLGIRAVLKSRHNRLLSTRIENAIERWRPQRRPSLLSEGLRKALLTAITVVATEAARRTVKNVIDGRLPDGRLAVGSALDVHHKELSR